MQNAVLSRRNYSNYFHISREKNTLGQTEETIGRKQSFRSLMFNGSHEKIAHLI